MPPSSMRISTATWTSMSRHMDIWDTVTPEIAAGSRRRDESPLSERRRRARGGRDSRCHGRCASRLSRWTWIDGDLDLYVVNDLDVHRTDLLINDGTGSFSDAADCGCDLEMFGMGATASDFNNDGFVDLNITDFGSPRTLMGMMDLVDATASSGTLISPSAERHKLGDGLRRRRPRRLGRHGYLVQCRRSRRRLGGHGRSPGGE